MGGATATALPQRTFDEEVQAARDDADADYSGWWCVATAPWPCPATGCTFVAHHLTMAHLVLVWPSQDDRTLLTAARDARDLGRQPRVVEYAPGMGPCIPYDLWVAMGRPAHGVARAPDGWADAWRPL